MEQGGQGLTFSELAALKEEVGASGRVLQHSVLGEMGGPLRADSILWSPTASPRGRCFITRSLLGRFNLHEGA
ncbi:hypothetical protein [Streptomyces sp. NPDC002088]|uniref:hypothetical protein n=1 Tax=Streptomyces sp. NPDC002088 TaxID=3154665 RepID=UPI0033224996